MTGFAPDVRRLIRLRADGRCERCGLARGVDYHHRRPRGMGGTQQPSTNGAANGLLLCRECHTWVESNRTEALLHGLLVLQIASPAKSAVLYRGSYVYLDDLGNITGLSCGCGETGPDGVVWPCQCTEEGPVA